MNSKSRQVEKYPNHPFHPETKINCFKITFDPPIPSFFRKSRKNYFMKFQKTKNTFGKNEK